MPDDYPLLNVKLDNRLGVVTARWSDAVGSYIRILWSNGDERVYDQRFPDVRRLKFSG